MGPHTLAEIEGVHHLPSCEVNDPQQATVRARLANSRVPINRHKGLFPVGRRRHFMTGYAILRDCGDLAARRWINDPERLVSLVGDQEQPASNRATRYCGIQGGLCAGSIESQQ